MCTWGLCLLLATAVIAPLPSAGFWKAGVGYRKEQDEVIACLWQNGVRIGGGWGSSGTAHCSSWEQAPGTPWWSVVERWEHVLEVGGVCSRVLEVSWVA